MSAGSYSAERPSFSPHIPDSLEKLGISDILVQDLVLRRVFIERTSTLSTLSKTLKLSPQVVETVFRQMRHRQLVEVLGMVGNDYSFMLSGPGRQLATERFQMCGFISYPSRFRVLSTIARMVGTRPKPGPIRNKLYAKCGYVKTNMERDGSGRR